MTPRFNTTTLGVLSALAICAGPAVAQSGDQAGTAAQGDMRCFNGYGYTLKGGDYRYTEHHEQQRENGTITSWDVTYIGKGGEVIATKHLDFSDNPTVPTYTLEMADSGYSEGIEHTNGQWTMFRQKSADAKRQTKDFNVDGTIAADSGFDQLVQRQFGTIMQHESVSFRFAAAGRQSVIDLRAKRGDDTTFEGEPAVVFIAELDMFLINYFVDSLKLTYDPDSKQLLEYRGIGNLHNDSGEVYPVRVTYSSEMPSVARDNGAPEASCGSVESDNG